MPSFGNSSHSSSSSSSSFLSRPTDGITRLKHVQINDTLYGEQGSPPPHTHPDIHGPFCTSPLFAGLVAPCQLGSSIIIII